MVWLGVGFGLLLTVVVWLWDAQLALRKRVADLERATGTGKPDRIADLLDDDQ